MSDLGYRDEMTWFKFTEPDGKLPTIEEGEELTDEQEKEEEEETEQEVDYHEGRLKQYEFGTGPPRKAKRKAKRKTKRRTKRR